MSVVVVAPDSFKGTAVAAEVAAAIGDGWRAERPGDRVVLAPMADGGEGTREAFAAAVPGALRHRLRVSGPAGAPVEAGWSMLPGGTALVELADTSGLGRMPRLAPFDAHTVGFGEAIADALAAGASALLLAVGGSSSTDGGAGALTALGARFLDADGRDIPPGNRGLAAVTSADLSGLAALPPGGARILSDVSSPLLGAAGAAAVFGPQKGASDADIPLLEAGLARFARVLGEAGVGVDAATPGAGAAGGTGFGLLAWGAAMVPGAEAVGDAIGLPGAIAGADAVITGEGRFDRQSASGKVPSYVAGLARDSGVPALLAAGAIEAPAPGFADTVSLAELAGGADAAMVDPLRWAREAGRSLARRFRPPGADLR